MSARRGGFHPSGTCKQAEETVRNGFKSRSSRHVRVACAGLEISITNWSGTEQHKERAIGNTCDTGGGGGVFEGSQLREEPFVVNSYCHRQRASTTQHTTREGASSAGHLSNTASIRAFRSSSSWREERVSKEYLTERVSKEVLTKTQRTNSNQQYVFVFDLEGIFDEYGQPRRPPTTHLVFDQGVRDGIHDAGEALLSLLRAHLLLCSVLLGCDS